MKENQVHKEIETVIASQSSESNIRIDATKLCLGIIHHPDPKRIGEIAILDFDRSGATSLSRLEPSFSAKTRKDGKPLLDPHLSRMPVGIEQIDRLRFRFTPHGKQNLSTINGKLLVGLPNLTCVSWAMRS